MADATLDQAAKLFAAKPLRAQRRILARLNEAALREPASAAELQAFWGALPPQLRAELLSKPAGCGCGARAGAFGPRLTRKCASCGAELHAPCLGFGASAKRLLDDASAAAAERPARRASLADERATSSAGAGEALEPRVAATRRDAFVGAEVDWSAACACRAAGRDDGDGDGASACVGARVAALACAFGAAGFGSEEEAKASGTAQPLVSRLRPACIARLTAYLRAWLRCVAAVAPPAAGVGGLAPLFKETLDHYASALSEARAASVAQADADGEPAADALASDSDDDGAAGGDGASAPAAVTDAPTASLAEPAAAQVLSARLARRRERLNSFTASLSPACYLAYASCARTALVPHVGAERTRCVAHLRAWLAPAELAAEGKALGAWLNAVSFLVRDRIAEVVGAALDARTGEWPERARKPLTLAELDEGIAAVGMEPVLGALACASPARESQQQMTDVTG